jgi:hypothetical protein
MSQEIFDLGAARCPDAMIYVRSALEDAVNNGFTGNVDITTIEPSMVRDLPFFINNHLDNKISITQVSKKVIAEATKLAWLDTGEAIDDDLIAINEQITFSIALK